MKFKLGDRVKFTGSFGMVDSGFRTLEGRSLEGVAATILSDGEVSVTSPSFPDDINKSRGGYGYFIDPAELTLIDEGG